METKTPTAEIRSDPATFTQQERTREAIAQRGRVDLFYLASVILGYNRLRKDTHGPFCRFHDTCKLPRRAFRHPRSHFKTSCKTIGGTIQWIINDANERILLVGNTGDNASRFLEEIKNHFARNALFRWLYPEVVWEDQGKAGRWNKKEMEVPRTTFVREPTIDTLGRDSEPTSRHFTKIVLDDIIGETEYESAAEMARACEWLSGVQSLLVPPFEEHQIDDIGNLWQLDDAHAFFEFLFGGGRDAPKTPLGPYAYKRGRLLGVFSRPVRENGKPIFPEEFPADMLDELQRVDPHRFAAQYMNDPLAEGVAEFQTNWLKYYNFNAQGQILLKGDSKPIRPEKCRTFMLCDPSLGKHKKSSRTAIHVVVMVLRKVPQLILLDSFVGRIPPDQIIDKLFEFYDKYPWISIASIESVAFQAVLKNWIEQREAQERRPPLPIVEYFPKSAKDSMYRIKGLQPICRAGQLHIQEGFSEFIDEYTRWHPKAKDQDSMDALAQVLEYVDFGYTKETYTELERFDKLMSECRSPLTGY